VQDAAPGARVVKTFNTVGNSLMLDPLAVTPPMTMLICGDDAAAKETATELVASAGWAVTDIGSTRQAGAIEGLGLIWVRHGVVTRTWDHIVTVRPSDLGPLSSADPVFRTSRRDGREV
jgi:predicted dinucleotide-binding enzyme